MPFDDPTAHWSQRLRKLATGSEVVGAALGIWHHGDEITTAHGVLSTATGVDVTPESVFQIGSITKIWTTTMIQQLAQEGRLSLDSTVADVLPGTRIGDPDSAGEVQVRHLLTHTSGIDGDLFTDTGRGDDCVERYVGLLAGAARHHPAGATYSYCNSGFVLLGRMIEVLDGRTWDESLRERLIGPLGLRNTVTLPEEAILRRAAVGHRDRPHQRESVGAWALPRSIGPAGLITADVHDVLGFARMHLDGGVSADGRRVLGAESVAAMQEPQTDIPSVDDRGDAVGLGWRLNRWGGRRVIGHDGGTIGQLAYLRIDPEAGLAVCLLTNSLMSASLYQHLFTEIFTEYVGAAPPQLAEPGELTIGADLKRHIGRYERSSWRCDLTLLDGALHATITPTGDAALFGDEEQEEFDLHPVDASDDAFVVRSNEQDPWSALSFATFPDGTPYLFLGGRATPRVEDPENSDLDQ